MEILPEDEFYVVRGGKPSGPYTLPELRQLSLSGSDFVKKVGAGEFREIRESKALSKALGLEHQVVQPQYFASLDMRLLACAIDYFIAAVIVVPIALVMMAGVVDRQNVLALLVYIVPFFFFVKFILSVGFESGQAQASPGKYLLSIRVVGDKGQQVGFGRILARHIFKLLGVATLGMGFLMGFFNKRQQCLHDILARTLVVRKRLL